MKVELDPVAEADKGVLRELLNLYLYDLSPLADVDPTPQGRFEYGWLDHYWREDGRHPFFVVTGGALAGFVLVNRHTETGATWSIAEFFVLRRHRRRGVGTAAAAAAFARRPGTWEVCTDIENQAGIAFWRSAIASFTAGSFEERTGVGAWTGPAFLFSSEGRT